MGALEVFDFLFCDLGADLLFTTRPLETLDFLFCDLGASLLFVTRALETLDFLFCSNCAVYLLLSGQLELSHVVTIQHTFSLLILPIERVGDRSYALIRELSPIM